MTLTTTTSPAPAVADRRHPTDEPAVRVDGLRMRYGSREVLRGVDLVVRPGEVVALLGPNGAGKSTTVEILEGFRRRTGGSVRVLGVDPEHGDERWRARLGVVLQSWRDHGKWRVGELLEHLGEFYVPFGTPELPRPWPVDDLLAAVGLDAEAGTRISRLSGGQRRRLDLAVGLLGRPDLLFLDEPTTGLDPHARRDFHDLVRRLAGDRMAVLLTTHDLAEAESLADRVLILAAGRVLAQGTVAELARRAGGTRLEDIYLTLVPEAPR
jgi:ABC-2 type transport system ATP-binding protein